MTESYIFLRTDIELTYIYFVDLGDHCAVACGVFMARSIEKAPHCRLQVAVGGTLCKVSPACRLTDCQLGTLHRPSCIAASCRKD